MWPRCTPLACASSDWAPPRFLLFFVLRRGVLRSSHRQTCLVVVKLQSSVSPDSCSAKSGVSAVCRVCTRGTPARMGRGNAIGGASPSGPALAAGPGTPICNGRFVVTQVSNRGRTLPSSAVLWLCFGGWAACGALGTVSATSWSILVQAAGSYCFGFLRGIPPETRVCGTDAVSTVAWGRADARSNSDTSNRVRISCCCWDGVFGCLCVCRRRCGSVAGALCCIVCPVLRGHKPVVMPAQQD